MNDWTFLATSAIGPGAAVLAAAIVFVMANWNDWRHPRPGR